MSIEAHYPVGEPSLLDHFIQSSPDPAFIIDCQGRVVIWNRAMESLTGVMAADITGQGGYAHSYAIYKERKPILADIMLRPELESDSQYGKIVWHDNGNSAETENETRAPSRHLWAKASLLKDSAGQTAGVLETIRDITRLKQAEKQVNDNERRIRRLTQNVSDIICELDIKGRYMFVSDSCRKILGFEPEDLLGSVFLANVHQEDRSQVMFCYECLLNEFEYPALIIRHRHHNLGFIWLEAVASPIIEANGTVAGIVASLRDISDRIEAEKRRRLTDTVYSNMNEGVYITDENGKILDINAAGCKIIGYEYDEVIGTNMMDYTAEGIMPGMAAKQERVNGLPDHWKGDIEVNRKNGETMVAGASIARVRHNPGGEKGYVTVFVDNTEQVLFRQEQEALKEQMARVKRIASLNAMSAGIVHEIAQPLNAIKLVADGLLFWQKRGRVFEPDQVMEKINIISQQVIRISDIINHIRSFAGMSQTREAMPMAVNNALDGALQILGQQLANHEIEVVLELAPDLPMVMGEQHRLEEVLVNLLANSMHELDQLNGQPKQIICHSHCKKGRVFISVSDNGPGISEANLEKIFEPFFSTKYNSENMGLGLAIVQSIIASFNGNIVAHNRAAGGAEFIIDLPAMKKSRERKS